MKLASLCCIHKGDSSGNVIKPACCKSQNCCPLHKIAGVVVDFVQVHDCRQDEVFEVPQVVLPRAAHDETLVWFVHGHLPLGSLGDGAEYKSLKPITADRMLTDESLEHANEN
jgi:hypothetical protein